MCGVISLLSRLSAWTFKVIAASVLTLAILPAQAETLQTSVPHVVLMDADTRSVLFERDGDAFVTPASTVKIMTAEIVFSEIKAGRLKLTDAFTVSETAWRTGGALAHGSAMFAALNSRIAIEDLLRGLVVVSGNDAAIALAEGLAGSEGAFATRMTKRARELGLTRSTFTNAWGRADAEQKVTPREMALLATHVLETYPDLYKYFGEREFTWNKIKQPNRNPLLAMDIGADGLKTGNIDASGFGLVASAVQNGQRLVLALYGAKTAKERADEARKILLWGFRSFNAKTLFAANEPVGSAKVFGGDQFDVPLVSPTPIKVLVPQDATEKLSGRITYRGPLMAPLQAGDTVARLHIYRGALEILNAPLVTAGEVKAGSLSHRAVDAGLEYASGLFRKYVSKQ